MTKTLADLSEKLRGIDFCMLNTHGLEGAITARPMSNNREVGPDGGTIFFTTEDALMVGDIARDPHVSLTFQGKAGLFGVRPFFVAIDGHAKLIREREQFAAHWTSELDRWFKQGMDTPGLLMISVQARRVHYWDGEEEGEVKLEQVG